MSAIDYNNLLFEISQRLEELNVLERLLFMCRGKLASGSEDNIQDVLSLFKELEEQNNLGTDRMEVIKGLLKSFKEWTFFGRVKEFERKRKKYNCLLEQIIVALDELNELERLIEMCRGNISQESEAQIRDVRSLFKELENQNNLEYDRLDILKGILIETEKNDLLRELEEFEERRNQEDELKRKEDEFERRTGICFTSSFTIEAVTERQKCRFYILVLRCTLTYCRYIKVSLCFVTKLRLRYSINVPVNSKTAHPPRANPGAFDFFEKFWSNSPLCCQF